MKIHTHDAAHEELTRCNWLYFKKRGVREIIGSINVLRLLSFTRGIAGSDEVLRPPHFMLHLSVKYYS